MSLWTHIVASIDVDTHIECDTLKRDVKKMLKAAPKITGSEGDAEVFVNVLSGYNVFCGSDCARCEYKDTVRNLPHCGFTCDAPDDYMCPSGKYQTRVVITVIGDLRDRTRERTTTEWKAFKKFVEKSINGSGFSIRNGSCNIRGY